MDDQEGEQAVTIRFPRRLWRYLHEAAKAHRRSFNSEVVWALQEYQRRNQERTAQDEGGER